MVRRFFEALAAQDTGQIRSLLHAEAVYRDSEGTLFEGAAEIIDNIAALPGDVSRIQTYEALRIVVFKNGDIMKVKTADGRIRRFYLRKDPPLRRLRLDFAYNGTLFHGIQRQTDKRTVQGVLENILAHITNNPVTLKVAGRTDKGVHALAQTVHFDTSSPMDAAKMFTILQRMVPTDIRPLKMEEVPPVFHARYDALAKTYRYTLCHTKDPFSAHQSLFHPRIDNAALQGIIAKCLGTHDFRGFANLAPDGEPVKTLHAVEVYSEGDKTHIEITGTGFLRHMMRIIVGNALRDITKGTNLVEEALENPERDDTKFMAPAAGLALKKVHYT